MDNDTLDYVINGEAHGPNAAAMNAVMNRDSITSITNQPGLYRPYFNDQGVPSVVVNGRHVQNTQTGKWERKQVEYPIVALQRRGINVPVMNATSLTKQAWQRLDQLIVQARRTRLRAWTDAVAAVPHAAFNAYAKMTVEYHNMSDPGEAIVDMDGMSEGRGDSPLLNLLSVPLPITHSDFYYSDRVIEVSKSGGMPLPTADANAKTRRVMETIEDTLIGTVTGATYGTVTAGPGTHTGTSTVYGYTNYAYRVQKNDLTTPDGTNPQTVHDDILTMIQTMNTNGFYGPFMLYHSTGYSKWLASDYFRTGLTSVTTSGTKSLRERILENPEIVDIRRLDRLTSNYQLIMVQWNDPEVMEMIDGMPPTMLQWDTKGGMMKNFKIWGIQVGMLKTPYNGVSGILHARTASLS